jgi:hypothetical protein
MSRVGAEVGVFGMTLRRLFSNGDGVIKGLAFLQVEIRTTVGGIGKGRHGQYCMCKKGVRRGTTCLGAIPPEAK